MPDLYHSLSSLLPPSFTLPPSLSSPSLSPPLLPSLQLLQATVQGGREEGRKESGVDKPFASSLTSRGNFPVPVTSSLPWLTDASLLWRSVCLLDLFVHPLTSVYCVVWTLSLSAFLSFSPLPSLSVCLSLSNVHINCSTWSSSLQFLTLSIPPLCNYFLTVYCQCNTFSPPSVDLLLSVSSFLSLPHPHP